MSADIVLVASNGTMCELCRDKRECSHAYNGSRGVFCGTWLRGSLQREAYCCPEGTGCLSPMSSILPARCGVHVLSPQATVGPSSPSWGQRLKEPQVIVALVLSMLVLCAIIGMYFYTTRAGYQPRRKPRSTPKRTPQPQSPTSSSDSRGDPAPYRLHQPVQA